MMMFLSRDSFLVVCLILLLGSFTSCSYATSTSSSSGEKTSKPSFQLYILKEDWYQLDLGYERERAWIILKEADLGDSSFVITEDDIESYDWSEQSIMLTLEATTKLKESTSNPSGFDMMEKGFVVTLNNEWLYGGVVLESGSAMAIEYPVIYPATYGENTVFRLRPIHPIPVKYRDLGASLKNVIEIQEVHDFFVEQDKLTQ
jgi:hypothetical protein